MTTEDGLGGAIYVVSLIKDNAYIYPRDRGNLFPFNRGPAQLSSGLSGGQVDLERCQPLEQARATAIPVLEFL